MNEATAVTSVKYTVKLIGVLATAAGRRQIGIESSNALKLSDLISNLVHLVNNHQFEDLLLDSATNNPLPNVIILLNEQDCNLFAGLKTMVEPSTQITIIPVAHGG